MAMLAHLERIIGPDAAGIILCLAANLIVVATVTFGLICFRTVTWP